MQSLTLDESFVIRKAAQLNLIAFTEELGYVNAPFHNEIYNILQNDFSPLKLFQDSKKILPSTQNESCIEQNKIEQWLKRYMWLLPRGHGKSEVIDMNYLSWLIGNYPDIHVNIVTKTSSLSEEILLALMTRFESDERYIHIFGELKPKDPRRWTTKELIVNRREISKNPTVKATGLMGPITGGRSDLIICDDIIDEENIRTQLQIEKALTWHNKVLSPTLYPWGGEILIGTRWHYADIYAELMKQYPCVVKKAIINEETHKVLWPEYWSYQKLKEKRDEIGSIFFDCQYQNDPSSMEGNLLKAQWLHPWNETDADGKELYGYPDANLPHYLAIDPSLGENDYFGIAALAFDHNKPQGYLKDVWAEHLDLPSILTQVLPQKVEQYHPLKIFMETNFWQKLLTKLPELQHYPIVPIQTVTNKEQRFIPMSSHFQSKRVLVNPLLLSSRSEFWTEWVQFPRGQHDDALDCVEMVVSNVVGNINNTPKIYHA